MSNSRSGAIVFVCLTCAICSMALTAGGSPGMQMLTFVDATFDGDDGMVDGLFGVVSVALSPDDHHLYSASYGESAVAVFSRHPTDGTLTFVEVHKDGADGVNGIDHAEDVTVSPDGKHVYAVGHHDHAVAVFSRDSVSGTLTFVEMVKDGVDGVDGLLFPFCVAVSPDGKHVYVAAPQDDAVTLFDRNPSSGELTFVEFVEDGMSGVDGLRTVVSVRVSPDGKHVYAVGRGDSAVAVFSRSSADGTLSFVEVEKDEVDGVDGLGGATSVAVSPDGNNVYATGSHDDAVVAFGRDSSSGVLTYIGSMRDGVDGVDGLERPQSVAVSPDDRFVFVAARDDNAVAVFARNPATGALTFVEFARDGEAGVDGLEGSESVVVSLDGQQIYAAGYSDNAVVAFLVSHLSMFEADLLFGWPSERFVDNR